MAALFPLGRITATPGALELMATVGISPTELLSRHAAGDWGEVPPEDARENRFSVEHSFRIVSSYPVGKYGLKIWIITEADRSSTCLLLPAEY